MKNLARNGLVVILAMVLFSPDADAKAPRRRKAPRHPAEVAVSKNVEAVPASVGDKDRKRGDDAVTGEVSITAGRGPVRVGPPIELQMNRAGSRKIDLRSLPFIPPAKRERPEREAPPLTPVGLGNPGAAQTESAPPFVPVRHAPAPAPIANFAGLDFANWGAGHPPDTNGDVGTDYYIQTINTSIGVFRKSDGVRVAAFTFDTFMSQGQFGNLCDTDNFGDPVVLYDTYEDRWIITDFAFQLDASNNVVNPPGSFQCFAVSMTGDPVSGGWNYYSINTNGGLGDYPKFGIWSDGLYMSANMFDYAASGSFQNVRLYALNKTQMYAGSPTVKVVSLDLPSDQFTVLPANARLQTGTPPAGSPNYFASVWKFLDRIEIWKFHVDWDHLSASTVTGPFDSTMTFWWEQFLRSGVTTAPTPANALDTLYPRLMMQNQYANIGGVESLWNSHTVGAGNPTSNLTSSQSAVRFYQVAVTGGSISATTAQSFTYSPDTTVYRYMPSAAVNRAGDMAIGYTTSNATTNPALKYAGRLATDPVNTITQDEQTLFQGTGSQSGTCGATCERWGDYSAMTLDPDGCTFWYTNEYYAANGLNHQTRIGSFKFPSCTNVGAGGTVSGVVLRASDATPIAGALVQLGARSATTDASGAYSLANVPAGTYATLTASASGFVTGTATNVAVPTGGTATRNFSLVAAPGNGCLTDTTQSDFQGVLTNVDLTTTTGSAKLAKPDLLDQSNPNVNPTGFGVTTTSWAGQTFTAAISGQLTRADVELFCSGCSGANPNITVSIRATTTGGNPVPTGSDLATATLTGFNDGGAGGLKSVTFAAPLTITAGTRYAVIFRSTAARTGTYAYTCSCVSAPTYTNFDAYANGQRVTSTNSGSSWTADTTSGGRDLNFRIYVNAGYSTSGDLVSAIKDSNPGVGVTPIWSTLSWNGSTPASTGLKFQIAASNSANGPYSFVGPNGTAATFFTTSPASMSQFYGLRYLQYRAYLTTTNTAVTPSLDDVTLCFADGDCSAPITVTPAQSPVVANSLNNSAAGPAGETSYSWSIVNGSITSGASAQTVLYTAGASGSVVLTLNVVEPSGCQKSASATIPTVPPTTPVITLTTSGSPSAFGQSVTFTATFDSTQPTGTVTFKDGAATLGTSPVASGVATFSTSTLTLGSHSITATYGGDANGNFNAATSNTVTQQVDRIPTTVTLTSAPNPSSYGQNVTFTATLSPATTTGGSVVFKEGTTTLGAAPLIGGVATFTFSALATGAHSIFANYSGSTNYAPSSSAPITQTVNQATPTVSIISSLNPSVFGTEVTFTVTVDTGATGSVTLLDGPDTIDTGTLNTGLPNTVVFTKSDLTPGVHHLTASYAGDANFTAATSATLDQQVDRIPTTLTLTAVPSPSTYGQSVTLTAQLNSSTATGSVTFFVDGSSIGSAAVVGDPRTATLAANALTAGSHTLSASYEGDATNAPSTSNTVSQEVDQATVTVTLTSSQNPSNVNDAVTFTATLGDTAATGDVTFKDGTTTLGTSPVAAGVATLSTSALPFGTHPITATYNGDTNFSSATSNTVDQEVDKLTTSLTLTSSLNASTYGQSVTFTATITPSAATGSVAFFDGATPLGIVPLSGGIASVSTSTLTGGDHAITAQYGGSPTYAPSSDGISQHVNQATVTLTLISAPNPSAHGQSVSFTATVDNAGATGTVTFLEGATVLGTGSLSGTDPNVATFSTADLTEGAHDITASYGGDTNFATASSNSVHQVVRFDTATTLEATPNPSPYGQNVTFTATVSRDAATGTVTFYEGATELATMPLNGSTPNVATYPTSLLSVGSHSITATYNGDGNNSASTSSAVIEIVEQATVIVTLTSAPNPSPTGSAATFTATVDKTVASGTVQFFEGATLLGEGTLSGGSPNTATLTTSTLSVGSHNVFAVYGGDTNFSGATSNTVTQVVEKIGTQTALGCAPNASVFGQSVTCTATVDVSAATGSVTFYEGASMLGSGTLSGSSPNIATFTTSAFSAGSHVLTATYNGDATYAPSTSAEFTESVNRAIVTVTVTSSPAPSHVGESVTFTATVNDPAATGTVRFFVDGTLTDTVALSGGSPNVATFTTSSLTAGSHDISASYDGDANFNGATSDTFTQTVNKNATTTTVTASPNPSAYLDSVTFTANVDPAAASGGVTFYDNTTMLGSGTLAGGQATFTTAALSVATHPITAVYGGDDTYDTSTSTVLNQIVNATPTTTTVSSSLNPSNPGDSVTFTATVDHAAATGTVTFKDGSTVLGTGTLTGGVATFLTSTLQLGTHSMTATYEGDGNFAASTSAAIIQTVNGTLTAPADFYATATTLTSVTLTWSAVPLADHYEVVKVLPNGSEMPLGTPSTPGLIDSPVDANHTYIYRVRAVSGTVTSPSALDLATTFFFTNDPLAADISVSASDLQDIRTTVDYVRAAHGDGPATYTSAVSAGTLVRALDINETRAALIAGRGVFGLATTFTNVVASGGTIRALDLQEMRDPVK